MTDPFGGLSVDAVGAASEMLRLLRDQLDPPAFAAILASVAVRWGVSPIGACIPEYFESGGDPPIVD